MWTFPHYHPGHDPDWPALTAAYPWLADMAGVPQDLEWHGEGDVLTHTKMVAAALLEQADYQALDEEARHILFAAALMHDIEKRSTTTRETIGGKTRITSPRHAKKGEYSARRLLYTDIPAPFAVREQIAKLARWHGLPLWAIDKTHPAHRVISAGLQVNTHWLTLLARADIRGRICPDADSLLTRIDLFAELCRENDGYGQPRPFATNLARYHYLNHPDSYPDYEPYDDLKNDVYILSALPGSGKDTHIRTHHRDLSVLSLDDIRRKAGIDPTDKKGNGRVIQQAKEQARAYLRAGEPFVFNATNIGRDIREKWTGLFAAYHARLHLHYLEVPYTQLLQQNRNRARPVPEAVISRLLDKLDIPDYSEAHNVQYLVGGN
ncbi:AAA family ATPase [uncultured Cardiobacterium sp.]|uniref:AAA family ATPase n=1 Tax=uncultured Cardiobacterium sp. TaxID=417619 RepID=UPI00261A7231|nr:AAA family ATPase [uncultured Cardiobacterium sp.]